MHFGVLFEKIEGSDFPAGYYYAHIPALGLTTHGQGIEGAREAARDLVRLWIEEKRSQKETIPAPSEFFFSTLDLPDDALQSA